MDITITKSRVVAGFRSESDLQGGSEESV
jgi:hypothetical protein